MENNKVKVTFAEITRGVLLQKEKLHVLLKYTKDIRHKIKLMLKGVNQYQVIQIVFLMSLCIIIIFTPIGSQDRMAHLKAVYNSVKWI